MHVRDDERHCVAAANSGCAMIYHGGEGFPPVPRENINPYIRSTAFLKCVEPIVHGYCASEKENDTNS
jgi:hypothetical protein